MAKKIPGIALLAGMGGLFWWLSKKGEPPEEEAASVTVTVVPVGRNIAGVGDITEGQGGNAIVTVTNKSKKGTELWAATLDTGCRIVTEAGVVLIDDAYQSRNIAAGGSVTLTFPFSTVYGDVGIAFASAWVYPPGVRTGATLAGDSVNFTIAGVPIDYGAGVLF